MKYTEVERKFALPDADLLRKKLVERDAKLKAGSPTRQVDTYYNAPHRDFLALESISEWLRVRVEGHGASLNFKLWHPIDGVIKTHADEYETTVSDPEAVRRILTALDFTEMVTVDKNREEYVFMNDGAPVIVAIDTIEGMGAFVEFEFTGDASGPEDAAAQLDTFIADLDVELGEQINRGYPHMMLGREH